VHNCAPLAKVRGVGAPDIGTGEDWFKNLDPAEQQQMMGPGKYAAWKAQEFDFGQLVGSYNDPIYGSLMREETLRGILGDRALDYYGKAA